MHDQGHALLVVGNAQAIGLVAVDAKGLVLDHAGQIDGVHMRNQHDAAAALALEFGMHHGADFLGRVIEAVDVAGLDHLDLAALSAQLARDVLGDLLHARHILAAGLDVHQIAQRIQIGLLLLFRMLQPFGLRGSLGRAEGQHQGEGQGAQQRGRGRVPTHRNSPWGAGRSRIGPRQESGVMRR